MEVIRLDKFVWAVRLYKSRSIATEECKKGRVMINGQVAKPSRQVEEGDIIAVKRNPIFRQYRIVKLLNNRVGAKLVTDYILDVTPEEDLFKLKLFNEMEAANFGKRDRGTGRPTKKERRNLDDLIS